MVRALLLTATLLAGCASREERAAREQLAFEGMTQIDSLEAIGGGVFLFRARTALSMCRGSVTIGSSGGRTSIHSEVRCVPDEQHCFAGARVACMKLARLYEEGAPDALFPIAPDLGRALELYARACDFGNAAGCNAAGRHASLGSGGHGDERRAAELYGRACLAGSGKGCFEAGRRSREGTGVDQDYDLARRLFAQGCRLGHEAACSAARW